MVDLIGPPEPPEGTETSTPDGLYEAINVIRDICPQHRHFGTGRWRDELRNYGYNEYADWVWKNREEFIMAKQYGPLLYVDCFVGVRIELGRIPWS